jgi:hypothetical protein
MIANRPQEVYHYTTGQCFRHIVADGVIKPAVVGVPAGDPPVVWLTINPDWDETANKAWRSEDGSIRSLSREETGEFGGGLVRFVVEPKCAPCTWREYVKRNRIEKKVALAHADSARQSGVRPEDWRVAFQPIPRAYWLRVDVWHDGEWRPVEVPAEERAAK